MIYVWLGLEIFFVTIGFMLMRKLVKKKRYSAITVVTWAYFFALLSTIFWCLVLSYFEAGESIYQTFHLLLLREAIDGILMFYGINQSLNLTLVISMAKKI